MKQIVKYSAYLFIFFLILIIGLSLWLRFSHASLEPQAKRIIQAHLNQPSPLSPDNANVYLWGMDAPENQDIYTAGIERIEQLKQNPNISYSKVDRLQYTKICNDQPFATCLVETYLNNPEKTTQDLTRNAILLKRYQAFAIRNQSQEALIQQVSFPAYHVLVDAQDTTLLRAVQLVQQQKPQQAFEHLTTHIGQLRKHLALANTLIYKMILDNMLSKALDVLSVLHNDAMPKTSVHLHDLNAQEKNFQTVFDNEVVFVYYYAQHYADWILAEDNKALRLALIQWLNPDNTLINYTYRVSHPMRDLTHHAETYLTQRHLIEHMDIEEPLKVKWLDTLINSEYSGFEDYDLKTTFLNYQDRIMSLDNKFKLLRLRLHSHTPVIHAQKNPTQWQANTGNGLPRLESPEQTQLNTCTQSDGSSININDIEQPAPANLLCYPHFVKADNIYQNHRCLTLPKP